jgi:hypothetical protein
VLHHLDKAVRNYADCKSADAAAEVIEASSLMSSGCAGHSACPGYGPPGQLEGPLRASLPGKTVTGQDPASLNQLDLLQRRQRSFVIVVHEAAGVAARSQSGAQSDYRTTTSEVGE